MSKSTYTRVAIVTGAAQGIGRTIALRLAADGLSVAVNDLESKLKDLQELVTEIEAKGGKALAVPADVSSEESVKSMVEKTVERLGRLDVMVANAGVDEQPTPIAELSMDKWRMLMSVNLDGVALCYKYAAAEMIKQGDGGRIIGASSICGKKGFAYAPAYSAAKFAVRGLTQCVALELAQYKITVNAYAPGVIATSMAAGAGGLDAIKEFMKLPSDTSIGSTDDVANFVSYVASPPVAVHDRTNGDPRRWDFVRLKEDIGLKESWI
ncbi:hypothetical protein EW146_g4466 [Bondarzewia mesenterica]|uniref:NAD(P)-binding protein n=1 Tax=Bondarzewia mesenterica TaxID=1095465 RepID=A0A4S4LUG8_9AGAM|nr:hypothetical protein EW146_g4466 [Bondarzewia mesenterica]